MPDIVAGCLTIPEEELPRLYTGVDYQVRQITETVGIPHEKEHNWDFTVSFKLHTKTMIAAKLYYMARNYAWRGDEVAEVWYKLFDENEVCICQFSAERNTQLTISFEVHQDVHRLDMVWFDDLAMWKAMNMARDTTKIRSKVKSSGPKPRAVIITTSTYDFLVQPGQSHLFAVSRKKAKLYGHAEDEGIAFSRDDKDVRQTRNLLEEHREYRRDWGGAKESKKKEGETQQEPEKEDVEGIPE